MANPLCIHIRDHREHAEAEELLDIVGCLDRIVEVLHEKGEQAPEHERNHQRHCDIEKRAGGNLFHHGHGPVDDADVLYPVYHCVHLGDDRPGLRVVDERTTCGILVLDGDRDDLRLALHLHGGHAGELFHRLGQPARVDGVLQDGTAGDDLGTVSYTHLRAHETRHDLVC